MCLPLQIHLLRFLFQIYFLVKIQCLKKIQLLKKNHPILAHVSLVYHDISCFHAWISVNPVLQCLAAFSFIPLLLSIG